MTNSSPTTNASNQEKSAVLRKRIVEIITEGYISEPQTFYNQSALVDIILDEKNSSDPIGYSINSVQPSVSRALKKLVQDRTIIKKEDNTYIPFSQEEYRKVLKLRLIQNIIFTKPEIFKLTDTSFLLSVHRDSFSLAKDLLMHYIGTDNCYDIIDFNGYLLVLIKSHVLREDALNVARLHFSTKPGVVQINPKFEKTDEFNQEVRNTTRKLERKQLQDIYAQLSQIASSAFKYFNSNKNPRYKLVQTAPVVQE